MTFAARRAAALVVLVVVVAGVALLAAVFAPRWAGHDGGSFTVDGIRVTTSIDPQSALVGDPVVAVAHVFVDSREIDPTSVKLAQAFTPFGTVTTRRSVTTGIGSAVRVDFVYRLQCVTVSCLYAMERVQSGKTVVRPIPPPAGKLTYRTRSGATSADTTVTWPSLILRSRLDSDATQQVAPRPPTYRAPRISYAISPSLLGWLAIGFAIATGLAGGVLVTLWVKGRPRIRGLRIPDHLTPIDRAVALVRHARTEGDTAGERRALERLAAALRDAGEQELALRAQTLAWSKDVASDDALGELQRELTKVGNGR